MRMKGLQIQWPYHSVVQGLNHPRTPLPGKDPQTEFLMCWQGLAIRADQTAQLVWHIDNLRSAAGRKCSANGQNDEIAPIPDLPWAANVSDHNGMFASPGSVN
jgi:hypothetical protein